MCLPLGEFVSCATTLQIDMMDFMPAGKKVEQKGSGVATRAENSGDDTLVCRPRRMRDSALQLGGVEVLGMSLERMTDLSRACWVDGAVSAYIWIHVSFYDCCCDLASQWC